MFKRGRPKSSFTKPQSTRKYHTYDDRYGRIPLVDFDQLPEIYITMTEWAKKFHVTRQAAHQLFRAGLIRGVKTFRPGCRKVSIYLDKNSEPPRLKSWQRRSLAAAVETGNIRASKP